MNEEKQMSRRDFLGRSIWALGGLMTAGIGIPAIGYIIGPALQQGQDQNLIHLGATSKVELGVPTLFKVKLLRRTGWIVDEQDLSIYVRTDDGRNFIAMSNICTHLGCRIRWVADRNKFFCPCHAGIYDKDGNVVSGPPPRPLDRYEVKVEDGQLLIVAG